MKSYVLVLTSLLFVILLADVVFAPDTLQIPIGTPMPATVKDITSTLKLTARPTPNVIKE